MPAITFDELTGVLLNVRGCTPVTMFTYTIVEMKAWDGPRPTKKNPDAPGTRNPFFGRTWKRAKVNGMVGFWYEKGVNRRRVEEDKEPDFVALPHCYHEHIPGCPVVYHRDDPTRLYLPILDPRSLGYQYEVDGEPVATDIITPWLREREEGKRQGLDNPRRYREYKLESIIDININGMTYELEHPNAVRAGA